MLPRLLEAELNFHKDNDLAASIEVNGLASIGIEKMSRSKLQPHHVDKLRGGFGELVMAGPQQKDSSYWAKSHQSALLHSNTSHPCFTNPFQHVSCCLAVCGSRSLVSIAGVLALQSLLIEHRQTWPPH